MSIIDKIISRLIKKKLSISIAESCTGGLIASNITKINGASKIFSYGIISYSNKSKIKYLSVSRKTLNKYGAVSSNVALEMINGLYKKEKTIITISTTGIAGPNGGTKEKPVGLVYVGLKKGSKTIIKKNLFKSKKRVSIQKATVNQALKMILNIL